jgi:hypothetical protein
MGQVYQCWWIYQEKNVVSRFEYHMFYVLLSLPHILNMDSHHFPKERPEENNITGSQILLIIIRMILCANFELKTNCPDRFFHDFPQSLQSNARIVAQLKTRVIPSTFFPIHYLLFISHHTDIICPKPAIFNRCASIHWCDMKGPLV